MAVSDSDSTPSFLYSSDDDGTFRLDGLTIQTQSTAADDSTVTEENVIESVSIPGSTPPGFELHDVTETTPLRSPSPLSVEEEYFQSVHLLQCYGRGVTFSYAETSDLTDTLYGLIDLLRFLDVHITEGDRILDSPEYKSLLDIVKRLVDILSGDADDTYGATVLPEGE